MDACEPLKEYAWLMDACEPLKEYTWLVDAVRRHQAEKMNLDVAVDAAVEEMPETFVII